MRLRRQAIVKEESMEISGKAIIVTCSQLYICVRVSKEHDVLYEKKNSNVSILIHVQMTNNDQSISFNL